MEHYDLCFKCGSPTANDTPVCIAHGALTDYEHCVICNVVLDTGHELDEYCEVCKDDYYAYSNGDSPEGEV